MTTKVTTWWRGQTSIVILVLIITALAVWAIATGVGAAPMAAPAMPTVGEPAPQPQFNEPVVRAVMFWMDTCSHCHEVIEEVLPPLQQQYGVQMQIVLVEIKSAEEFARLYPIAALYGIPRDYLGVPFLIIGDHALLGADQIQAKLPGLIEQYLAAGGVDLPDVPGLAELLSAQEAEADPPGEEYVEEAAARPSGFSLAVAVLVGMMGALVLSGVLAVRVWRTAPPQHTGRRPAWLEWATPLLVLVGLAVAGYLAYVEMRAVPAVCGPVGDCNAVQSSPYARLFGVLPVGLLGVLGYLAIQAAWLWGRLRSGRLARYAPLAVFSMALFGTLFSLYLTYLEPFVIRAVCAWCLTSAVVMTLLMVLSLGPALQTIRAGANSD